jgi:hypothetical protein
LSFALLAVQKANCALGQDCTDDGHRAWLGGRGWWWGTFWGGHVGSYRRQGVFFSERTVLLMTLGPSKWKISPLPSD